MPVNLHPNLKYSYLHGLHQIDQEATLLATPWIDYLRRIRRSFPRRMNRNETQFASDSALSSWIDQQMDREGEPWEAELLSRSRMMTQQWRIYGPGMVSAFVEELQFRSEPAIEVAFVIPARGGFASFGWSGKVICEAVLEDSLQGLPEVLRLAWAVCGQLISAKLLEKDISIDSPTVQRKIGTAALGGTLKIGNELSLNQTDGDTIRLAANRWLDDSTHSPENGDDEFAAIEINHWYSELVRQLAERR